MKNRVISYLILISVMCTTIVPLNAMAPAAGRLAGRVLSRGSRMPRRLRVPRSCRSRNPQRDFRDERNSEREHQNVEMVPRQQRSTSLQQTRSNRENVVNSLCNKKKWWENMPSTIHGSHQHGLIRKPYENGVVSLGPGFGVFNPQLVALQRQVFRSRLNPVRCQKNELSEYIYPGCLPPQGPFKGTNFSQKKVDQLTQKGWSNPLSLIFPKEIRVPKGHKYKQFERGKMQRRVNGATNDPKERAVLRNKINKNALRVVQHGDIDPAIVSQLNNFSRAIYSNRGLQAAMRGVEGLKGHEVKVYKLDSELVEQLCKKKEFEMFFPQNQVGLNVVTDTNNHVQIVTIPRDDGSMLCVVVPATNPATQATNMLNNLKQKPKAARKTVRKVEKYKAQKAQVVKPEVAKPEHAEMKEVGHKEIKVEQAKVKQTKQKEIQPHQKPKKEVAVCDRAKTKEEVAYDKKKREVVRKRTPKKQIVAEGEDGGDGGVWFPPLFKLGSEDESEDDGVVNNKSNDNEEPKKDPSQSYWPFSHFGRSKRSKKQPSVVEFDDDYEADELNNQDGVENNEHKKKGNFQPMPVSKNALDTPEPKSQSGGIYSGNKDDNGASVGSDGNGAGGAYGANADVIPMQQSDGFGYKLSWLFFLLLMIAELVRRRRRKLFSYL